MTTGLYDLRRSLYCKNIAFRVFPLCPRFLIFGRCCEKKTNCCFLSTPRFFTGQNRFSPRADRRRQGVAGTIAQGDGRHASAAVAEKSGRGKRGKAIRLIIDPTPRRRDAPDKYFSLHVDKGSYPAAAEA